MGCGGEQLILHSIYKEQKGILLLLMDSFHWVRDAAILLRYQQDICRIRYKSHNKINSFGRWRWMFFARLFPSWDNLKTTWTYLKCGKLIIMNIVIVVKLQVTAAGTTIAMTGNCFGHICKDNVLTVFFCFYKNAFLTF